jgi:D-aminoacyl-tRNA deacylase
MQCIICSEKDTAAMLIKGKLTENFGFSARAEEFDGSPVYGKGTFRLLTIKEDSVYADYADLEAADLLIFASRHASKTGPKTFTVHAPGNWGKADFGGKEKTLAPTSASLVKNYLLAMQEKRDEMRLEHLVSVEQTHHGPDAQKPSVFIEMGSNKKDWKDEKAAELIADTITGRTSLKGSYKAGIGIGGKHYSSEFTKLMLRTEYALGHMCPEYALGFLDEAMLRQAAGKTSEKLSCLVVDYKDIGSGSEKQRVKRLAEDFSQEQDLELLRVRKLLKEAKST